MTSEPEIRVEAEQPYVAIAANVTMSSLGEACGTGFGRVFGWLGAHGIEPGGPPFVRYLVIDMDRELEIETAVPVGAAVSGDEEIRAGVLPGGRYATLVHSGPYSQLVAANATLQEWVEKQGLAFDYWQTDHGSAWRGRVERYLTDPAVASNPDEGDVEVAYLLRK